MQEGGNFIISCSSIVVAPARALWICTFLHTGEVSRSREPCALDVSDSELRPKDRPAQWVGALTGMVAFWIG